jgi:DNA-binding XRE family transcriptional regulator
MSSTATIYVRLDLHTGQTTILPRWHGPLGSPGRSRYHVTRIDGVPEGMPASEITGRLDALAVSNIGRAATPADRLDWSDLADCEIPDTADPEGAAEIFGRADLRRGEAIAEMAPYQLRRTRKTLGLTQGQLAEALGVTYVSVGRWERGEVSIPSWLPLAIRGLVAPANEHDIA